MTSEQMVRNLKSCYLASAIRTDGLCLRDFHSTSLSPVHGLKWQSHQTHPYAILRAIWMKNLDAALAWL